MSTGLTAAVAAAKTAFETAATTLASAITTYDGSATEAHGLAVDSAVTDMLQKWMVWSAERKGLVQVTAQPTYADVFPE